MGISPFDPFINTLTRAQFQWILLNDSKDKDELLEHLKLLSYVIDPQRAKALFEVKPEEEHVTASSDWFIDEVKKQSNMDPKQVEELLKTDSAALEDPTFTVIERQS